MKKNIILISVAVIFLISIVAGYFYFNRSSEAMRDLNDLEREKGYSIALIAQKGDAYSSLENDILDSISEEYDIEYEKINYSEFSEKEKNIIKEKYNISGTSMAIIIYKNSKLVDVSENYLSGTDLVKYLKEKEVLDKSAVFKGEEFLTFINYSEFLDMIKENKNYIVTIGQTACTYCIKAKPVLNYIAGKYDIDIYYLNLTEMSASEQKDIDKTLKDLKFNDEEFVNGNSFGTPLTLIIKNKEIHNYINGFTTTSGYVSAFEESGLIK